MPTTTAHAADIPDKPMMASAAFTAISGDTAVRAWCAFCASVTETPMPAIMTLFAPIFPASMQTIANPFGLGAFTTSDASEVGLTKLPTRW